MINKGITLGLTGKPGEEIAVYDELIERFKASIVPDVQVQMAAAMRCKSITLEQENRHEDAITADDELIERFQKSAVPDVQVQVAEAMFHKGITLGCVVNRCVLYYANIQKETTKDDKSIRAARYIG